MPTPSLSQRRRWTLPADCLPGELPRRRRRAEGIAVEEIAAEGIAAEGNAAEGNAAVGNDAEGTGLRASAEALTPAVASASGGTGRSSDIINRHRRARR